MQCPPLHGLPKLVAVDDGREFDVGLVVGLQPGFPPLLLGGQLLVAALVELGEVPIVGPGVDSPSTP